MIHMTKLLFRFKCMQLVGYLKCIFSVLICRDLVQ